jgi:hypothetical protein
MNSSLQRLFNPRFSNTDLVYRDRSEQINIRLHYAREVEAMLREFYKKGQIDSDSVDAILSRLIKESLQKNTKAIKLLEENRALHKS